MWRISFVLHQLLHILKWHLPWTLDDCKSSLYSALPLPFHFLCCYSLIQIIPIFSTPLAISLLMLLLPYTNHPYIQHSPCHFTSYVVTPLYTSSLYSALPLPFHFLCCYSLSFSFVNHDNEFTASIRLALLVENYIKGAMTLWRHRFESLCAVEEYG